MFDLSPDTINKKNKEEFNYVQYVKSFCPLHHHL